MTVGPPTPDGPSTDPAPPAPPPLRVKAPAAETTVTGERSYVLGRGRDADIVVDDTKVSRHHLVLAPDGDGWLARDTSANGVWYDGRRIGTSVRVSAATVRLRLGAADGPTVVLNVLRAPGPDPSAQRPAAIAEAETRLAGSAPAALRPAPVGVGMRARNAMDAGGAPATSATGPPAARPAGGAAASGAAAAGAAPESAAARWARLVPTLLWLAATGFAIGALIALS
ncbi:MAG: FHA domain-containing protein [Frankia sp.]